MRLSTFSKVLCGPRRDRWRNSASGAREFTKGFNAEGHTILALSVAYTRRDDAVRFSGWQGDELTRLETGGDYEKGFGVFRSS